MPDSVKGLRYIKEHCRAILFCSKVAFIFSTSLWICSIVLCFCLKSNWWFEIIWFSSIIGMSLFKKSTSNTLEGVGRRLIGRYDLVFGTFLRFEDCDHLSHFLLLRNKASSCYCVEQLSKIRDIFFRKFLQF